MNFFFGIKTNLISSRLNVPRFKNNSLKDSSYKLFSALPEKNYWKIDEVSCDKDDYFYFINKEQICNRVIFFLAKPTQIKNKMLKLENFNHYTNTSPDYRSNLRVQNKFGGFSSYQSEYPFTMVKKKGNIISPISSLANKDAETNMIFLRNIYLEPIHDNFEIYFINLETKEILYKNTLKTNYTNEIEIEKKFIKESIYLFTKNYIGVPIFCSINNHHMSFEHTHPPHEYLLSNDKFSIVKKLKENINEILN